MRRIFSNTIALAFLCGLMLVADAASAQTPTPTPDPNGLSFLTFKNQGNSFAGVTSGGGEITVSWNMPYAGKVRNLHVVCESGRVPISNTFTIHKKDVSLGWRSTSVTCTMGVGVDECENDWDLTGNEASFGATEWLTLSGSCGTVDLRNAHMTATAEVVDEGGNPYHPVLHFGTYANAVSLNNRYCSAEYGNNCQGTDLTTGWPMTRDTTITSLSVKTSTDCKGFCAVRGFNVYNQTDDVFSDALCAISGSGVYSCDDLVASTAVGQGDEIFVWQTFGGAGDTSSHSTYQVVGFEAPMGQLVTMRGPMWASAEDRYINRHFTFVDASEIDQVVARFPRCATVQRLCASKDDVSSGATTVDVCVSNTNPPDCSNKISVSLGAGLTSDCNTVDTTAIEQGAYWVVRASSPGVAVGSLAVSFEAAAGADDPGDTLCAVSVDTPTATSTPAPTDTPTAIPTSTGTPQATDTATITPTGTPTSTPTISPTPTPSAYSICATFTPTPTATFVAVTAGPTKTPTPFWCPDCNPPTYAQCLASLGCCPADARLTANLGLCKIDKGTQNWGDAVNCNSDQISTLFTQCKLPAGRGGLTLEMSPQLGDLLTGSSVPGFYDLFELDPAKLTGAALHTDDSVASKLEWSNMVESCGGPECLFIACGSTEQGRLLLNYLSNRLYVCVDGVWRYKVLED